MFDIKKAAEIISPYQEKIYALYDELKSELKKEFGESYNAYGKPYIPQLFYVDEEDAISAGMEKEFSSLSGTYFKARINGIEICALEDIYTDILRDFKKFQNRGNGDEL